MPSNRLYDLLFLKYFHLLDYPNAIVKREFDNHTVDEKVKVYITDDKTIYVNYNLYIFSIRMDSNNVYSGISLVPCLN
jgi:hypothetical protein